MDLPMLSRRVVSAITGVYVVAVIVGGISVLNVLRLAEKHIDRGEELTRWSKAQIVVGHFFVQNGYFLLALSSFVLISLWVAVGVLGAFRNRSLDRGTD
jgi:hypothetical protein